MLNREEPNEEIESALTLPKRIAAGAVGLFVALGILIFMPFRPLLSAFPAIRVIQNIKTFVRNVINTIPFLRRFRPPEPEPQPVQNIVQPAPIQQIRSSPSIERLIEGAVLSIRIDLLLQSLSLNFFLANAVEEDQRQLNQVLAASFFENQERIQRQQIITTEKCQKIIEKIQPLQGNIPKLLSEDEIKKYKQFIKDMKDTSQQANAEKELKFYLKVIEDMRCPITQYQLEDMDNKTDTPVTVVLGKNHQLYNKQALLTYVQGNKFLDLTNHTTDLSSVEMYGGYPTTFWEGNKKIYFNIENFVNKVRSRMALITSAERRESEPLTSPHQSTSPLKTQSLFASNKAKKSNPATAALIASTAKRQKC